jgi:hypothetical protein
MSSAMKQPVISLFQDSAWLCDHTNSSGEVETLPLLLFRAVNIRWYLKIARTESDLPFC